MGHRRGGCAGGDNVVEYGDARLVEWYAAVKRIGNGALAINFRLSALRGCTAGAPTYIAAQLYFR